MRLFVVVCALLILLQPSCAKGPEDSEVEKLTREFISQMWQTENLGLGGQASLQFESFEILDRAAKKSAYWPFRVRVQFKYSSNFGINIHRENVVKLRIVEDDFGVWITMDARIESERDL